jgi:hypothetical protein
LFVDGLLDGVVLFVGIVLVEHVEFVRIGIQPIGVFDAIELVVFNGLVLFRAVFALDPLRWNGI